MDQTTLTGLMIVFLGLLAVFVAWGSECCSV